MQKQEFKKFITRLLLFLSPIFLAWVIELFVLPINYFTFRVPEALIVHSFLGKALLPGPFYPNFTITAKESGGLGVHTTYEQWQENFWQTDALGHRKSLHPGVSVSSPIVIIGDSHLAGLTLSQAETLSEQLQKIIGKDVYPLDFSGLDYFLSAAYPASQKPEVVILEASEKSLLNVPFMDSGSKLTGLKRKEQALRTTVVFRKLQPLSILLDRMSKQTMYNFLRSKIDYALTPKAVRVGNIPEFTLFDTDPQAYENRTGEQAEGLARKIMAADKELKRRGIRFIFLPVPNKENIYWQYVPGQKQPIFLPELIVKLREAGVEVADTQSLFSAEVKNRGAILYQADDYHWNRQAVELTANMLKQIIEKPQQSK